MKTFYAVTDGDYSDYHIIAITDNKERAENIKKLYSGKYSEPMIEEFFDGESKDEALYDVWYKTDGSYELFLQGFDMNELSNINIVKENTLHNDWWKYREKTELTLSRLHKICGQNTKQRKKVLYDYCFS